MKTFQPDLLLHNADWPKDEPDSFPELAARVGLRRVVDDPRKFAQDESGNETEKSIVLFVYGTLKHRNVMSRIVGHSVEYIRDSLLGYRHKTHADGYDYLEVEKGAVVAGYRVSLSAADVDKLDKTEDKYERKPVTLVSGVKAETYFLKEKGSDET